jgi:hypothetical protein
MGPFPKSIEVDDLQKLFKLTLCRHLLRYYLACVKVILITFSPASC